MYNPSFFDTILVWPITNVLVAVYHVLFFLHIPYALGFSIIILTIIVRLILYPFTASQLKASRKMQQLAPHISKIKEKHKEDKKRIQEETMSLYKQHGVNPAAGCLPMLVQIPVIWALYAVLQQVVGLSGSAAVAKINAIVYMSSLRLAHPWDQQFFGIPLGQNPSHLFANMPIILAVPIITGVLQYIQSRMMIPPVPATAPVVAKKKEDDFAQAFQTQSLYLLPIMIGFFSYRFPIGLSLYWNTFTVFGILQQYKIQSTTKELSVT